MGPPPEYTVELGIKHHALQADAHDPLHLLQSVIGGGIDAAETYELVRVFLDDPCDSIVDLLDFHGRARVEAHIGRVLNSASPVIDTYDCLRIIK